MLDFGILGKNARNIKYIKKLNKEKAIRIAENKAQTKQFLKERGIPVPEIFGLIKDRDKLYNFDFSKLPKKNFIIKPNKGSKGTGIFAVKYMNDISLNDGNIKTKPNLGIIGKYFGLGLHTKFNYYYKIGEDIVHDSYLRKILADMLDGKFSESYGKDDVLVEEKVIPGDSFKKFCKYGLADIRIIIYNMVPVAAMIRVPTFDSKGKANLYQGGIGMGIEIGTGKINCMYYKKQIFTKNFPGEFSDFEAKKIPYWDDILLFSSKVQYFTNIGFLGIDRAITNDGPKVIEINPRSGLEVQNAGFIRLKNRLQKISDMKVNDPEKGLEIAKNIFNQSKTNIISLSKVLYLSQKAYLKFKEKNEDEYSENIEVNLKVDLNKENNLVGRKLYDKIEKNTENDLFIDIPDNNIRFKNIYFELDENIGEKEIILGHNSVGDYYIKPVNKVIEKIDIINPEKIVNEELEELQTIDQKISKISGKVNLSKILTPINYLEELDNFITRNGNYNPKFKYDRPDDDLLDELFDKLQELQENKLSRDFGLKSKFANIFLDKVYEIENKILLIKAYKKEKYKDIYYYNCNLFGEIDDDLLELSKRKIFLEEGINDENKLGKELDYNQIRKKIKNHLRDLGMNYVKLVTDTSGISRLGIIRGKVPKIKISNIDKFREKELDGIIAHEIDVHLQRYINGKLTGWSILKDGTGNYILDEEGLAIYKSYQVLPEGYEKLGMYNKYYLIDEAQKHNFSRIVYIIKGLSDRTLNGSFKTALRLKRGIQNTGFIDKGAIFMKDKVYLEGYNKITNWVENGGKIEDLMLGKIKIEDLDKIY